MANLILEFNNTITYSDGTYVPNDDTDTNNKIIHQTISYNGVELIANAAVDVDNVSLPSVTSELQSLSSSYIITVDADWVTTIRDRNITRFVFDRNSSASERFANIIFKHNVEKEVYCQILITQSGEQYELTFDNENETDGEITFTTIDPDEEKEIKIICTGGCCEYNVHKVRKYTIHRIGEGVDDVIVKRSNYDNALSVFPPVIDGENHTKSVLTIHSNGSLITDNSYYEVILEHKDVIGLTLTIKVNYPSYNAIESIEDVPGESEYECEEEQLLPPRIPDRPDEEIIPSIAFIDRDNNNVTIRSDAYCEEILVETVPMESQIYFKYYGSFVAYYEINDYIDSNDNIYHGLTIKAKPNVFGIGRNSVGYIINAMYPQVRIKVELHQDGNT